MIETLRETENSKTAVVTFRWQGTTFSLGKISSAEGANVLKGTKAVVGTAAHLTDGKQDIYTILLVGPGPDVAGVSIILSGSVPDATGNDT